ncbi:MAG TPA: 4'-phosphopantetheinyl transferase superfamily protein [Vicinamibacterales bacterium]|jgi:holo-[acyl-carrier protein] synthase
MGFLVGIDLVDVVDIDDSVERYGNRYLTRVYTQEELASWQPSRGNEWLATCFAAKEATLKALGAATDDMALTSVALQIDASGRTGVALSGAAATVAADAGIREISVSVTPTRGCVAAVALAETTCEPRETAA